MNKTTIKKVSGRCFALLALMHFVALHTHGDAKLLITNGQANRPNIVMFLTDDQDSELGGMEPLVKTKSWLAQKGTTFTNSFVSTPVCCPSRASILTGRYQIHTNVVNNSMHGNCWGNEWRITSEKETFAAMLKASTNYTTCYAGKYLNCYGHHNDLAVPEGWDWWAGLVGNSR